MGDWGRGQRGGTLHADLDSSTQTGTTTRRFGQRYANRDNGTHFWTLKSLKRPLSVRFCVCMSVSACRCPRLRVVLQARRRGSGSDVGAGVWAQSRSPFHMRWEGCGCRVVHGSNRVPLWRTRLATWGRIRPEDPQSCPRTEDMIGRWRLQQTLQDQIVYLFGGHD